MGTASRIELIGPVTRRRSTRVSPAGFSDRFLKLLREEMAPQPHRVYTTIRSSVAGAVGAGIIAAAHIDSPLGPYLMWLLAGTPTAMLSWRAASILVLVEAMALTVSVPLARVFAQSPVLMLAFLGAFTALSTWYATSRKLGALGLITQVLVLDSFYGVVFAPKEFGWTVADSFSAVAIGCGVIAVLDNWLWPDPAEKALLESLAAGLHILRARLLETTQRFLSDDPDTVAPSPSVQSNLATHLTLLARARAEGTSAHRRAVLLGAVTRVERIGAEVVKLSFDAGERVPHGVRRMLSEPIAASADAIAAALDELASDSALLLESGPDRPPPPAAAQMLPMLATLQSRVVAARPAYIVSAGADELANFGSFLSGLQAIARLLERPLDEPAVAEGAPALPAAASGSDPALIRYSLKVGLSIVVGYVIGLASQRPELSVILTTVIIAGLPTYGASARKMILRLIGAVLGGAITIAVIMIVTPNFDTLPVYMMAIFVVLMISGYTGQSSGRTSYAGKQLGTTFLLAFTGLSPAISTDTPLYRVWGILIGTFVVTAVFLVLWPEYAGESMPALLRKALAGAISLAPGAAVTEAELQSRDRDLVAALTDLLTVAGDARLEGLASRIDPDAVVQAAGSLRRVAHRLSAITLMRIQQPRPSLDAVTESAGAAALAAVHARLAAWLALYESGAGVNAQAAAELAARNAQIDMTAPLAEFASRVESDHFARLDGWSVTDRGQLLTELQCLRRLEFLSAELDRYLAEVPVSTASSGQ